MRLIPAPVGVAPSWSKTPWTLIAWDSPANRRGLGFHTLRRFPTGTHISRIHAIPKKLANQINLSNVTPLSRLPGKTVLEPKETMKASSEERIEIEARPVLSAANQPWLRNALLVVTVLSLAVLTLKATELTADILAAIEPVEEWFNLPF
jgi:hypothetical protein